MVSRETDRDLHGRALVSLSTALILLLIVALVGAFTLLGLPNLNVSLLDRRTDLASATQPPTTPSAERQDSVLAASASETVQAASPAPAPEAQATTTTPTAETPPASASLGGDEAVSDAAAAPTIDATASPDPLASLLAAAAVHEAERAWALALIDYGEALALDASSQPARAGLERVQQAIAEEKFQAAMSAGLTALANEQYAQALTAFREAQAFDPDSAELADGIAQAQAGIRREQIRQLERQAQRQERAERWAEALAVYREALAVDPNLAFARDGSRRMQRLGRAEAQLRYFLGQPELLYSAKGLEQARQFLADNRSLGTRSAGLRRGFADLEQRVASATTPLPVELRSDEQTEVAVYHVGRLGRFRSHRLQLRPGDYTVVGSRSGYKDVRLTLRVRPNMPPLVAEVICSDPI